MAYRNANGLDESDQLEAVYDTLNAVAHVDGVEVEEKPDTVVAGAEVAQQLCGVDRQQLLHGLQFDHNGVLDEQVQPVADVERQVVLVVVVAA